MLIANHCRRTGETYADIARRGGLPRQTVSALMQPGRELTRPHVRTLDKLAAGLELSPNVVRAAATLGLGNTRPRSALLAELAAELDEKELGVLLAVAHALRAERDAPPRNLARSSDSL